ncbi:uncharacterized protein [Parasteatoda tepidariorum]|uniref:uncharacterized protein n=1 Tax=Parasteatoda tepidariorum TaxID=114398 RepID=UPI0039BC9A56
MASIVEVSFPESDNLTWACKVYEKSTLKPFKCGSIKELFEKNVWSLILKEGNQIKAYVAFCDFPRILSDNSEQMSLLNNDNQLQINGVNSLFLSIVVGEMTEEYMDILLMDTFCKLPLLIYCCIVTNGVDEVDNIFKQPSWQNIHFKGGIRLLYKERKDLIPKVGIRSKRCEDYIALKNIFSQMYSSLSNNELQSLTLDFLDFGEDKYPTYKYFTYDEDNTCIAIADAYKGDAVGFMFATTLRVDLNFLNEHFQLETVRGLKKKNCPDKTYEDPNSGNQVPTAELSTDDDELDVTNGINSISNQKDSELDVKYMNEKQQVVAKEDEASKKEHTELDAKHTDEEYLVVQNVVNATSDKSDTESDVKRMSVEEQIATKITKTSKEADMELDTKRRDEGKLAMKKVTNESYLEDTELDVNRTDQKLDKKEPGVAKVDKTSHQEGTESAVKHCINDVLNSICKTSEENEFETNINDKKDLKYLFNSKQFDLSNSKHMSLITDESLNEFSPRVLVKLINSDKFDTTNAIHMKLVSRLGKKILDIQTEKQSEIVRADLFDPSQEDFALLALYILEMLPDNKIALFRKSSIGFEIYEKAKYKHATSKQQSKIKLSYMDKQIIIREAQKMAEKNISKIAENQLETSKTSDLKNISYRNMGFISGSPSRAKYRIQNNYSSAKIREPFEFLATDHTDDNQRNKIFKNNKNHDGAIQNIHFYSGIDNCFFIEQLAVEKKFEHEILNLIQAGFKHFPMMDYSILLLPYGTKQVPLLRQHFSPIPARPFSAYNKELFVFHKAGLNRKYSVRRYQECDLEDIKNLIYNSCLKTYLLDDLNHCLEDADEALQGICLISEDQILGIAIVSSSKETDLIRRSYDIAERINVKHHEHTKQGELKHCVLHPIAKSSAKFFLKEVMRISEKSILYYKIYPSHEIYLNPLYWQSLCNILDQLIPLKPVKKQSKQSLTIRLEDIDNEAKISDNKSFSLCFTCTKMVLQDKKLISARIIIAGNSDNLQGVLEGLIYNTNYRFTNLTLITKSNAIGENPANKEGYKFLPYRPSYSQDELDRMCLPIWVTIVRGSISNIKNNVLRVMSNTKDDEDFDIGFEYLVLCEDLQFQRQYLKRIAKKEEDTTPGRYSLLKNIQRNYEASEEPTNVFTINDENEGVELITWLRKISENKEAKTQHKEETKQKFKTFAEIQWEKRDGKIVIHGNCLEAFIAIAVLLEEKLHSFKLVYVKSSELYKSGFKNKAIKCLAEFMLTKENIEIYEGALEYEKEAKQIYYVDVLTETETIRLDCRALILFSTKNINYTTFGMLQQSSLSFTLPVSNSNGYPYLIINEHFHTNVKSIFAVGSITKMLLGNGSSLRLEDISYNQREIGLVVGTEVGKTIAKGYSNDESKVILKLPKVTVSKLVGGYRYISIYHPHFHFLEKKNNKKNFNSRKLLVLGNLQTGKSIVPERIPQEGSANEADADKMVPDYDSTTLEIDTEKTSEENFENTSDTDQNESQLQNESSSPSNNLTFPESKSNQADQEYPQVPEFFAVTISKSDNVESIECFTGKTIDADSLISLYGIQANQLYKIIQIEEDENHNLFFTLMEDWILPLDYFTFVGSEESEDVPKILIGYDSYWRSEYPADMQTKVNTFLRSFTKKK